jgi:phage shock protein E
MQIRSFLRKKYGCLLILLTLTCTAAGQTAVQIITQDQLKDYLANGAPFDFILIDVRSPEEAADGGIGNAQCKPYNLSWPEQLKKESARIPKDLTVIVYCRSGGRARNAAAYLGEQGFTKVYSAGGMLTWTGPTVPLSEFKAATLLPETSMKAKTGQKTSR